MDIRVIGLVVGLSLAGPAFAQLHTATGPKPKPIAQGPRAAHNSMAKSTTPFNCEQHRWPAHPHPGMKPLCDGIEAQTLQDEAQRAGRPGPSADVVRLPGLGTEAAKRSGTACIGGQAMRRLENGWEQVTAKGGGWQRCVEL
jgi:hypothetical protein